MVERLQLNYALTYISISRRFEKHHRNVVERIKLKTKYTDNLMIRVYIESKEIDIEIRLNNHCLYCF